MKVELIRCTEAPIEAIEIAASNCYDSEPSDDGRIMNACYESGHHSVLEFADVHFKVSGISRAAANQLVRHRTGKFAQRSQRYIKEGNFGFVVPPEVKEDKANREMYDSCMSMIQETYNNLVANGVAPEDARFVLPNACETVIDVKFDLRNFIHFCNERLCTRAQWEIRQLAQEMVRLVVEQYPQFKKYLVPKCEIHSKYPFCTEQKSCGRHPKLKDVYNKVENKQNQSDNK